MSTRFDPFVGGPGAYISYEDLELDSMISLEIEKIEQNPLHIDIQEFLAGRGRDYNS